MVWNLDYTKSSKFSTDIKRKEGFWGLKMFGMDGGASPEVEGFKVILSKPFPKNNKIIKIAFPI